MSGPGAMVSSAEATRKSPISGIDPCPQQKSPVRRRGFSAEAEKPSGLHRLDRHGALLRGAVRVVLHVPGGLGEERVVLADAHVRAGVELRAALADEDRARVHELA